MSHTTRSIFDTKLQMLLDPTQKSQRPLSDLEGQVEEQWEDYADTLVSRGMAAYGDVDIDSALYSEWARGIEPDGLANGMRAMAL